MYYTYITYFSSQYYSLFPIYFIANLFYQFTINNLSSKINTIDCIFPNKHHYPTATVSEPCWKHKRVHKCLLLHGNTVTAVRSFVITKVFFLNSSNNSK